MLAKGSSLYNFGYTFSNRDGCVWNIIKAIDFQHAAKSLYNRVPPNERFKRVRLYPCDIKDDGMGYDGAVSGLKTFFC